MVDDTWLGRTLQTKQFYIKMLHLAGMFHFVGITSLKSGTRISSATLKLLGCLGSLEALNLERCLKIPSLENLEGIAIAF